jgi:hypothetical protein
MPYTAYSVVGDGSLRSFRGINETPPPPPAKAARQIWGSAVPITTTSMTSGSNLNSNAEEARMAELFGWPNSGPPVQRIYRGSSDNPPYGIMTDILGDGRIPWVSLKPGPGGPAADLAGTNDAYWDAWAAYFRSFWPLPIWFSYDHETDRHSYSGSSVQSNAQWRAYQQDQAAAFVRFKSRWASLDTTHGNSHMTFVSNLTGFAFLKGSSRDPGYCWHPDIDVVSSDPYDFRLFNDGSSRSGRHLYIASPTGTSTLSTGATEHYQWCMDPEAWYAQHWPGWEIPSIVANNLDKFPVRMAIGETGCQFNKTPDVMPNPTQWIPLDDPEDPNGYQATWFRQLGVDLRTNYPRLEVICHWPSSTQRIGSSSGSPNYFHGPADRRWGAFWPASIDAFRAECVRGNHAGEITPWGPGGLL